MQLVKKSHNHTSAGNYHRSNPQDSLLHSYCGEPPCLLLIINLLGSIWGRCRSFPLSLSITSLFFSETLITAPIKLPALLEGIDFDQATVLSKSIYINLERVDIFTLCFRLLFLPPPFLSSIRCSKLCSNCISAFRLQIQLTKGCLWDKREPLSLFDKSLCGRR